MGGFVGCFLKEFTEGDGNGMEMVSYSGGEALSELFKMRAKS